MSESTGQSPSTGTTDQAQADPGATPGSGATPDGTTGPALGEGATPPAGDGEGKRLEAALKAERDARRKAEKDLADLRKSQEAGQSDAERLATRVTELEAAKAKAEHDSLVLKIATETGLPPLLAARLQGSDETSLREDAEALKQALPTNGTQPQNPTTVGGPQGAPASGRSPEEWLSVIRKR